MRTIALLIVFACLAAVCPLWAAEAPPPTGSPAATAPAAPAPAVPAPAPDAAPARRAPRPSVGRIVLYRLKDKRGDIVIRPAIVVRVWERQDDEMPLVQLQVFTDGSNDGVGGPDGIVWKTSVHYDEAGAEGTWSWMPYQLGQAAKNDTDVAALRAEIAEIKKGHQPALYELLEGGRALRRLRDGAIIPADEGNKDWREAGIIAHLVPGAVRLPE